MGQRESPVPSMCEYKEKKMRSLHLLHRHDSRNLGPSFFAYSTHGLRCWFWPSRQKNEIIHPPTEYVCLFGLPNAVDDERRGQVCLQSALFESVARVTLVKARRCTGGIASQSSPFVPNLASYRFGHGPTGQSKRHNTRLVPTLPSLSTQNLPLITN